MIKSTGLGDRFYSSLNKFELKPKRSRTLSSGLKVFDGSCLEISIKDPSVEMFGLFVNR